MTKGLSTVVASATGAATLSKSVSGISKVVDEIGLASNDIIGPMLDKVATLPATFQDELISFAQKAPERAVNTLSGTLKAQELAPAEFTKLAQTDTTIAMKLTENLGEFLYSRTMGAGDVVGETFLNQNPNAAKNFIEKGSEALTQIKNGQPLTVYTAVPDEYVNITLQEGVASPSFLDYIQNNQRNCRMGNGRYFSLDPETPLKEIENRHATNIDFSILKTEFHPSSLASDFKIYPSVRSETGGINLVDRELVPSTYSRPVLIRKEI